MKLKMFPLLLVIVLAVSAQSAAGAKTFIFPKNFDAANPKQDLTGVKMVQVTVGDVKTTNAVTTRILIHHPGNGSAMTESAEGLIWFDLSSIPKETKVTSATLSLLCQVHYVGNTKISMQRVLLPWTEKANWETYDGENKWHKAGGNGKSDMDLTPEGSVEVPPGGAKMNTWYDFDVTRMVKMWVGGEAPNYGMKSKSTNTGSVCEFKSAVWSGTNFIKLTITAEK